jgi:hypothetical protein
MKRILTAFVVLAFFAACNEATGIKDFVAGSDSVAINFYKGDGSMDSVVKVVILRDSVQVSTLAGFIEAKQTHHNKCGVDGSLHFFKRDVVLKDVDFTLDEAGCMQFSFFMNGKSYYTELSTKAKGFLSGLKSK